MLGGGFDRQRSGHGASACSIRNSPTFAVQQHAVAGRECRRRSVSTPAAATCSTPPTTGPRHPQRRRPLRRLQHQSIGSAPNAALSERSNARSRNAELQPRPDLKPLPIGSVYAAYATSSNPVGVGVRRHQRPITAARPSCRQHDQIFGPEKNKAIELGTKWELFDRHLLVTGALFQTKKDNARENRQCDALAG